MTDRATSFGVDAARYDEVRPGYPPEVVDRIAKGGDVVLDIAAGTGLATKLFADRGINVLGVEPDARMVEVATASGLVMESATFEEWEDAGRRFDAVVCAQAWWWLDKSVALPKIARILSPGGRVGVLWNSGDAGDDLTLALADAYERIGQGELREPMLPGGFTPQAAAHLEAANQFTGVATEQFRWTRDYDRDDWVDAACTFSDVIGAAPHIRRALLDEIRHVIDRHGGQRTTSFVTTLVTAKLNT